MFPGEIELWKKGKHCNVSDSLVHGVEDCRGILLVTLM